MIMSERRGYLNLHHEHSHHHHRVGRPIKTLVGTRKTRKARGTRLRSATNDRSRRFRRHARTKRGPSMMFVSSLDNGDPRDQLSLHAFGSACHANYFASGSHHHHTTTHVENNTVAFPSIEWNEGGDSDHSSSSTLSDHDNEEEKMGQGHVDDFDGSHWIAEASDRLRRISLQAHAHHNMHRSMAFDSNLSALAQSA